MIVALMAIFASAHAVDMKNDVTKRIDEVFGAVYNNPNEPGAAVFVDHAGQ